jgi:uncharacterized membrane protein YhaH (DUF805 family)
MKPYRTFCGHTSRQQRRRYWAFGGFVGMSIVMYVLFYFSHPLFVRIGIVVPRATVSVVSAVRRKLCTVTVRV